MFGETLRKRGQLSEEYSFVWGIEGFYRFRSCPDLLANQQQCFIMCSQISWPTIWKCSLVKSHLGGATETCLSLLDYPQDASKIVVNFRVYSTNSDRDKWFDSAFTENMLVDGQPCRKSLPDLIGDYWTGMLNHCQGNQGTLRLVVSVTLFDVDNAKRQNFYNNCFPEWKGSQEKRFAGQVSEYYKKLTMENAKTILVSSDDQKFPVMRDMLCAQSPVFARMFQSGMVEANGIVKISDVSGKPLKLLLDYIHTGNLSDNWTQPDAIEEFVYATHKYMLKDLLEFEDNMLGYYCTRENADALLDLANFLELKRAEKELRSTKNKGGLWKEKTQFPQNSRVWQSTDMLTPLVRGLKYLLISCLIVVAMFKFTGWLVLVPSTSK